LLLFLFIYLFIYLFYLLTIALLDSYGCRVEPADLLKAVNNCKDKGRVSHSMHLFGHGDGGGGPTPAMLENFRLLQNTAGLPQVC
jgi:alpha-mannosidase